MDTINFDSDPESSSQTQPQNGKEGGSAEDGIAALAGMAGLEDGNDSSRQDSPELNLDDSAVVLFEDDNYVFTTEGIINKDSRSQQKQDNSSDAEPGKDDEKILGKFDSYDDLAKSYKELESKLGEKSQAAEKLRELQPVLPMLEAMLNDDTFLDMAEGYFTDPEKQRDAMKKHLGIDDDFVFDLNNALSDPKSEDAKVLNKLMQAQQPKKQTQSQTETSQYNEADKKALMDKFKLDEDGFKDMMAKAQNYKISYEDIYFLLNKDKVLTEAEKRGQAAIREQMGNANKFKKSPSAGSKRTPDKTPEDTFMESLMEGEGLFAG